MSQIVKVGFQGDEIEAVREGADVWVSVRRVCEALGLARQVQQRKLVSKEWAAGTMMVLPSEGGPQTTFMLHLDALPMWLATIEPARVKPEVRGKLARYQIECARVLRDHFFPRAAASPPEPAPRMALAGVLGQSAALLADMRRMIGAAAKVAGVREQRVRGWIVREFRAASFIDLPLPLAAYVRERLMRIVCGEEEAPFRAPRQLADPRQQVIVYPRPDKPQA